MNEPVNSDPGQRRHTRVEVPLLVQYRFGALEEPHFDYALNVSQSGLFISTTVERPVGTKVFIQLTTRDGAHFLQGEGKVVRSAEGGYAIELTGFDEDARGVLEGLVQQVLADQAVGSRREKREGPGSLDRSS